MAGEPHSTHDESGDGITMSFFGAPEPTPQPTTAAPPPPQPSQYASTPTQSHAVEYDEFGLLVKKAPPRKWVDEESESEDEGSNGGGEVERPAQQHQSARSFAAAPPPLPSLKPELAEADSGSPALPTTTTINESPLKKPEPPSEPPTTKPAEDPAHSHPPPPPYSPSPNTSPASADTQGPTPTDTEAAAMTADPENNPRNSLMSLPDDDVRKNAIKMFSEDPKHPKMTSTTVSEWSHQQIVPQAAKDLQPKEEIKDESEDEWQTMPAYASTDLYDDYGRLIAVAAPDEDTEEKDTMGGAVKGYTRVFDDEDADSVTSMDENTKYLFQEDDNDEDARNPLSQMEATKELLTEGQRIAYVGVVRLAVAEMVADRGLIVTKGRTAKKVVGGVVDNMRMWGQKMMVRLYTHMEISPAEQIMIEQLAEHGVVPSDLTPTLRQNFRVRNPMAPDTGSNRDSFYPSAPGTPTEKPKRGPVSSWSSASPPPPYEESPESPGVKAPSDIKDKTLDIDLRWTVLCDLFLVLIADSVYDARARTLMERVGKMLDVNWMDICKFEKRVTDALEMQENTEQNWSEQEFIDTRDKEARNKRYLMLGLATVGGGLIIGLTGGLMAPMIGAGLVAGFSTIGVGGTAAFLGGSASAAIITTTAVGTGSYVGGKAGFNRMKSVKTFEFRPLHNAKRMNLIITVSGWMNGKIDDVRLPFSTVDPIMGDLFSVFWEPDMLQSMGQTLNILATEVLTQSLQQVLGATILTALMSAMQLPLMLTKLSYLLDNPWSVSLERAQGAGLILADTLMSRNLGVRPTTLVGYSLGARVIYYCLRELARHGQGGLVQNVYLFGCPVVVKPDEFAQAVSVVSGRFVNGYSRNDWILGYLFRATSGGIGRVAGLAAANVEGVENVDVTDMVPGHMGYRQAMPKILKHVGFEVISEEFTEIEDPDPDNHNARQRELIDELAEARKELEKQPPKKKLFGLFSRKDAGKKKDWEMYEASKSEERSTKSTDSTRSGKPNGSGSGSPKPDADNNNEGILFDLDAIKAEVAALEKLKDQPPELQPKELNSTMPGLKIFTGSGGGLAPPSPGLRHTKSFNDALDSPTKRSQQDPFDEYDYFGGNGGGRGRGYSQGDGEITMSFEPAWGDEPTVKPELKSRATMPATSYGGGGGYGGYSGGDGYGGYSTAPTGGRNVWADDDDDEFKPKGDSEMTMTFA